MRRRPRYRLYLAAGVACVLIAAFLLRPDLARRTAPPSAHSPIATQATATQPPTVAERISLTADSGKKADEQKIVIDVGRFGPHVSVFAGRAPPRTIVVILADGQLVASTKADETGGWVAIIEREFTPGEHELSLRAEAPEGRIIAEERTIRLAIAPPARNVASTPSEDAAAVGVAPLPITFIYDETAFTSGGDKAAAILRGYLSSHHFAEVVLSGHADERGSDRYNIELSRQRLEVVARYLRDHGFAGRLKLVPKGKSEPYTGVDRQTLSREDALQLDRRVELRMTR